MFVRVSDGELDADVIVAGIADTPAIVWGAAHADGVANSVVRTDATLMYPPALIPVSGGTDTVTLTESGSDTTLTWTNSGQHNFQNGGTGFSFRDSSTTSTALISCNADFDNPTNYMLRTAWSAGTLTSATRGCWDARIVPGSSAYIGSTVIGYDMSSFAPTPNSSSDANNVMYGVVARGPSLTIGASNNFGLTEVAGLYAIPPKRLSGTYAGTVTLDAGIITEPATLGGTAQYGILIRQATAARTATNRYGLYIVAQNSGTTKYSIRTETDQCLFGGKVEIDGDLDHDGTNVGFYGVTPVARSSTYSPSNVTTDRSYDANSTTVDELADVLGTLIADLQLTGIIG